MSSKSPPARRESRKSVVVHDSHADTKRRRAKSDARNLNDGDDIPRSALAAFRSIAVATNCKKKYDVFCPGVNGHARRP